MTVQQMRAYLVREYPHSKTWPARVSRMTDGQVTAVYLRIIRKKEKAK